MILTFDTKGNDKQKECAKAWLNDEITEIVYGGSKGSAKSFTGCKLIFHDALVYDGTFYFIARKKLNDLRKFTIPSIYECFEDWGLKVSDYMTYNGQDSFFQLINGSRVYLLDAAYMPSDPLYQRFGSMQFTRGWIEEAGEFEEAAKSNLAASIGRWLNDKYKLVPKLLQTCNPSKNYLYLDYKANKEGKLERYKKFIQALPTDNKCLPKGYLENLDRVLSKAEKERLLYGNWEFDNDPATLIEYNNIIDMFTNKHVQPGKKYLSADIARFGSDKTSLVAWDGLRAKITKHEGIRTTETAEKIRELQRLLGIQNSNTIADEDGVGGGVVDILLCKGFVNNSRPLKNPITQKDENFNNLKSQCYFKLAEYINAGLIYVECDSDVKEMLIEELEQVKQDNVDSDGKKSVISKEKVKAIIGRSPDFADALMMRMYFELKGTTGVLRSSGSRAA
jgi:phage terminase large subunit